MYQAEKLAERKLAELEKVKPVALYWNDTGKGKKKKLRNKSIPSWSLLTRAGSDAWSHAPVACRDGDSDKLSQSNFCAVRMLLEHVTHLPEDMISHQAAVNIKAPKPIHGLEVSHSCMLCPGVDLYAGSTMREIEIVNDQRDSFSSCECSCCWEVSE